MTRHPVLARRATENSAAVSSPAGSCIALHPGNPDSSRRGFACVAAGASAFRPPLMATCGRGVFFALGLFLAALGPSGVASAATYHVAANGDDNNPGTQSQPWATIGKANRMLRAGDTVLIHAGTYHEQIHPQNSGTSDSNRIVIRAFGDGNVNLTYFPGGGDRHESAISVGGLQYVTVSGRAPGDPVTAQRFRLRPASGGKNSAVNFCGGTANVVENLHIDCDGRDGGGHCNRPIVFCEDWWGDFRLSDGRLRPTTNNVFRNSYVIGDTTSGTHTQDLLVLAGAAHHNLIEGNTLAHAHHVVLNNDWADAHTNVVRNNRIINDDHTALSFYPGGHHHLVENNFLQATYDNPEPTGTVGNAMQANIRESIVRHNRVVRGGAKLKSVQEPANGGISESVGGGGKTQIGYNRYYNNSILMTGGTALGRTVFGGPTAKKPLPNAYANNLVYDAQSLLLAGYSGDNPALKHVLIVYRDDEDYGFSKDRWFGNVLGQPNQPESVYTVYYLGNYYSLAQATALDGPDFSDWHGFGNRYEASPGFVDYDNDDYRLRSDSPLVDAGAPLTRVATSDSNSGTSLHVEDARWFQAASGFAAWMNVQADEIAVGQTFSAARRVKIASVDHDAQRIVLTQAISRRDGDFVWLYRDSDGSVVTIGAAPDVGAMEFSDGQPPAEPRCGDGSQCHDGDGCCPAACTADNDKDCSPSLPVCEDRDGDGFGQSAQACDQPVADCDDGDAQVHPGATEQCNGRDDNCDGKTDEGFDLQTDTGHCGACGLACSASQRCAAGVCTDVSSPTGSTPEADAVLTLSMLSSDEPGGISTLEVRGARPGESVDFAIGLWSGVSPSLCGEASFQMRPAYTFWRKRADGSGRVRLRLLFGGGAAGWTLRFQSVAADGCRLSNVVVHRFGGRESSTVLPATNADISPEDLAELVSVDSEAQTAELDGGCSMAVAGDLTAWPWLLLLLGLWHRRAAFSGSPRRRS